MKVIPATGVFSSRAREFLGIVWVVMLAGVGFSTLALAKRGGWDYFDLLVPALLLVFFMVTHLAVRLEASGADFSLLTTSFFLATIGLVLITSLDESRGASQLVWLAIGLGVMILSLAVLSDYQWLAKYKYLIGLTGLALLLAPIVLGVSRGGAKLWLSWGGYTFQPSEPAKLLLIIFFAAYLQEKKEVLAAKRRGLWGNIFPEARHVGPLVVIWAVSLAILVLERDLGSSLLFFTLFLVMLYAASGRASYIIIGALLFIVGAAAAYFFFSHVHERVDLWLAPLPSDVSGKEYQLAQSLFVMADGGISGVGLGSGLLGGKIAMPAVTTDFVFAAAAEQLGLAGTMAIITAYLFMVYRGIRIALSCRDDFGKLTAFGLAYAIGLQVFVIVGGVIKMVPLTGVTLPFVSYGGSSLISNFLLIGALMAISASSTREPRETISGRAR